MAIGKITGSVVADNTLTESNLAFGISGQSAATSWATDTLKVNIIESDDSSGIQLNDSLNISGTLSANTIDVNQLQSGDSTNIRVADNLVPAADNTYSLGTPDRKWSALYVEGSTIFLDTTKLQVDGSGDFTVKDAGNNLKRVVASEIEIGTGSNKIKMKRGANGRVKFTDENDTPTPVLQIVGDDSTGVSLNTNETVKIAGTQNITTAVSGDTLTITGPDLSSYITAASTDTLTNKTFDANGTGNSITNIEVADFASGVLDTDISSVSGSDDTIASAKAIKTYVDSVAGGTITLGDSASNSGSVDINGSQDLEFRSGDSITTTVAGNGVTVGLNDNITVNQIGAKDSSDVSITSPLQLSSTLQVAGTTNLNGTTNLQTTTITENTTGDALLLTTTEDSSSAGPVITMKRNSGSPADADYLGQLKFKGENDADQEVVYAKITAKIQDASDGTEDGLIEFANKKAGSNVITARLRSDSLQLLNGTSLTVAGTTDLTGNVTMSGNLSVNTISSDDSSGVNINESKLYVNGSTVLTINTADEPALTTSAADVDHVIINDGGLAKRIALGNINVSSFNNDANYASAASTGFVNSTVTTIPISSDSTATDYSDDEPLGVGTATDTTDAFGVPLGTTFDTMEPRGSTQATDFGTEEAHVGA